MLTWKKAVPGAKGEHNNLDVSSEIRRDEETYYAIHSGG
jgi:hypothetical protein